MHEIRGAKLTGRAGIGTREGARSGLDDRYRSHAIASDPLRPVRPPGRRAARDGVRRRRPRRRGLEPGHLPVVRRREAARRRPAARRACAPTAKTPVILSIGPYFNHSGQTGPAGPVEDTSLRPGRARRGRPIASTTSSTARKLMERGYTFVMVDLRGFGGSTGCLDWGGPGEQSDVVNAVAVGGDAAVVDRQGRHVRQVLRRRDRPDRRRPAARRASTAVVSQEPVYDLYRYLYGDGMRRANSLAHPGALRPDRRHARPGRRDDPNYNVNGAQRHRSAPAARRSTTPTRPATTTTTRPTGGART